MGKDAFDGAVCLRLADSRRMDEVLVVPRRVLEGPGPARAGPVRQRPRAVPAGGRRRATLSRVIRLCLRFGVEPGVHPERGAAVQRQRGELQRLVPGAAVRSGGSSRPGDLRRELARLQEAVNTQHVHPRLGGKTPAQHRRGLRLQKLPASFVVPTERLPLAAGRVTFIRRVSVAGTVTVLSQSFRVGKRHRGLYLRLVVDTGRGRLTAYLNGRVLKRWPYKLLND